MNDLTVTGANRTGLTLSPEISYEEWQDIGKKCSLAAHACLWWLGDWWSWGEAKYGDRASQALETGYSYQTLKDAGWVARKIEPSRRRENLSWSIHREVAALDPDIQDSILAKAEEHGMTKKEVREAARAYKIALDPPKTKERDPDNVVIDELEGDELEYWLSQVPDWEELLIKAKRDIIRIEFDD